MVKNPPAMWETWVRSLGWEDPLEKEMATHSSILAWRIPMDRGAWWATVHGVTKSWTQLSTAQHDVWKCIRGFPLGLVEEACSNSIFCFTSPQEAEMEFTLGGSFKQDLNGKKGWKELNF